MGRTTIVVGTIIFDISRTTPNGNPWTIIVWWSLRVLIRKTGQISAWPYVTVTTIFLAKRVDSALLIYWPFYAPIGAGQHFGNQYFGNQYFSNQYFGNWSFRQSVFWQLPFRQSVFWQLDIQQSVFWQLDIRQSVIWQSMNFGNEL